MTLSLCGHNAICRVDAQSGGYVAVTDSSAIRDNPDVWYNPTGNTSYIVYDREAWDEGSLLGFGRGRKRGTGVFLSKHRKPMDGPMGGSLYTFALDWAEPNPARDRVTIRYSLPKEADVSLKVYSTAGRLVRTLAEGKTRPGTYTTVWDGTDAQGRELASGIYFYRLDAGDKRISRKVVLQH